MKFYHFTEQPYPAAWNDPHGYLRVDLPNRALDADGIQRFTLASKVSLTIEGAEEALCGNLDGRCQGQRDFAGRAGNGIHRLSRCIRQGAGRKKPVAPSKVTAKLCIYPGIVESARSFV